MLALLLDLGDSSATPIDMKRRNRLQVGLVATLMLYSTGCNPLAPSEIVGDWSGRDVPSHFGGIQVRLEQQGSRVVGTACGYDGVDLRFSGVPVVVDGSRITFSVSPGPGAFEARYDSDDKAFKGGWTRNPSTQIILERGGSLCAFAK